MMNSSATDTYFLTEWNNFVLNLKPDCFLQFALSFRHLIDVVPRCIWGFGLTQAGKGEGHGLGHVCWHPVPAQCGHTQLALTPSKTKRRNDIANIILYKGGLRKRKRKRKILTLVADAALGRGCAKEGGRLTERINAISTLKRFELRGTRELELVGGMGGRERKVYMGQAGYKGNSSALTILSQYVCMYVDM